MDKHKTSLNLNSEKVKALKIKAVIAGKTMTEALEEAIDNYVCDSQVKGEGRE